MPATRATEVYSCASARDATAKHFVSGGAVVYITGRRPCELQAALSELGDSAIGVQGDMMQLADLDGLFEQINSTHGRLDIVSANAGRGEFLSLPRSDVS
jgi:NAD(P)-dependent dehydrogenase (short-subunit alcohol dehydrogenase family)